MEPQNQEVDKSILFCTEIRAIDPNYPDEGIRRWSGTRIKALSWKQAEEFCLHHRGYLKVISISGDEIRENELVLDATNFSIQDDLGNNSIGQAASTFQQVDAACAMMAGCECSEEAVEDMPEEVEGFADGDTVMIKSGGPLMTVVSASTGWCECAYFDGINFVERGFPADCLVFVNR